MNSLGSSLQQNGQGMHAAVPSTNSVGSNDSNAEQIELTNNRRQDLNGYGPPSNKAPKGMPKHEVYDYVPPLDNLKKGINVGFAKAASTALNSASPLASICRIVLKAMMSGAYLGFSITLTLNAVAVGWDKVSAAMLFPTGFVMLILMGNDLATGNFALLPMAYLAERIQPPKGDRSSSKAEGHKISMVMIWVNWLVVYMGNFLGTLTFLFILWGGMTHFGQRDESGYSYFKDTLCSVSKGKVNSYMETGGAAGWFASFFNGILCNWMVTMGVLLAFSSRSTIGKIVAMYFPILIFICSGYEHSIVNLYLLPAGLAYECGNYSFGEWWVWNQIPVTLGNMFGGIVLTGFVYFTIWAPKLKKN